MEGKETILAKLDRVGLPLFGLFVSLIAVFYALPSRLLGERYEYEVMSPGSELLGSIIWLLLFGWLGVRCWQSVATNWNKNDD